MPFITKISTQKKNTERFNIFLDDKYAFSVDADVLVKFELKKGKELDDLDIIEIQYGDEVKKGFNRALDFLSYRMRSTKEVEDHLKKKETSPPVIAEVIHRLNDYKYLNDQEFASAYVSTHKKTNGKGPDVLFRELRAKGIDDDTIKEALSSFSFEDQTKEAVKHVEKLLKKDKKLSTKELKQRAQLQLQRKGFSFDVISAAMDQIEYENDEDTEKEALRLHAEKAFRKYRYDGSYESAMKVKQFLFRKGFSLDLIEQLLQEEEY
ncbi:MULTISPECIES: recombination regulator RecX [Bacillus]|uniref:recombination regulator RecX n=1 Tax=Bacillus TaxID=1386 RepID=UPI00022D9A01|nr:MULTISPECIES: recombination regulator RecX [Bacillus]MBU8844990.1 recombination regulator RecX [Alkalicoccobacillus gibsonii]EHA29199.1 recombination regulator RecX [Bacillus subtilis subsp. subtilis str. SC-8]KFC28812.1 recombinase RecX [Bacillus subtilis]MEA3602680.1 recombination regulator RecX [Bacillus subtilis]MEC1255057.1 recombination regulator RecX [Bacillus subtilis]